ncbi:Fc.00g041340.m01.CDS01 [Cosmosporella sp. VM-42]
MAAALLDLGTAAADMAANNAVPELSDAEYFASVLQLHEDLSENQIEDDLVTKANALGISTGTVDKRITSSVESASTVATYHARTFSMMSAGSTSTALTNYSSLFGPPSPDPNLASQRESKDLSFSQYDRYLSVVDPHHNQHKFLKGPPDADTAAQSVFSGKTKKSLFNVKSGFKIRWKKKSPQPLEVMLSCICCRADFKRSTSLHNLSCGHTYCADCLRVVVHQAMTDESRMPPRCCAQPIPGPVIKELLSRDGQEEFIKTVIQYSTPWQTRIFCPNGSCGEFIPPHHKVDPKHPFNVTCRKCNTRVCVMCKRNAHPTGKDCPEDWELDEVLKMGDKAGWRRCYKCRNLVELVEGCAHMTCRCKAQFCYICGGVWDATVGCPNFCDGEEELERRRKEEEDHLAEYEAEKLAQEAAAATAAAERLEAERRSRDHPDFQNLVELQDLEIQRFQNFTAKTKTDMRIRHVEQKQELIEKHKELEEKMQERHAKTISHLEDRQVAAEMDLRASLEQSERSVQIRLKHMEAYCDGLGRGSSDSSTRMPARVVTERDLRELGQQYNLRDGMERLHEAKINVMRDRQAKRMEELVDRQENELEKLQSKNHDELEDQAERFTHEEDALAGILRVRKARLIRRWELAIEILRKELEAQTGAKYALIATPGWPEENPVPAVTVDPPPAEPLEAVQG